ncbi:hypothetical protein Sango_1877000 [Sesamum angolense]|uniref:RNase H type-1 domain-containing protein n=1 Tax=Sesamum angolense TaxID=2727404 RepID=A0AAE1WJ05_9LAMI|nr:hypothetical protein Sango_1877000 [Sesamum angolense]
MISERGIEANPEKINAIMDMSPPKSIREDQKLAERLAALNRFISRSADKGLPFFKILRGGAKFEWSKNGQEAFDELKKYLVSPPLLRKPETGETIYLYLAVPENAVSSVLVRQENREHLSVYYVSKLLANPKLSERMVKWAVELSEYGIEFHSRPAIKAQVLADFVVELAYEEASISTPTWSLYVDGSSTSTGSGAGVALESPQGDKFEYAIKLDFPSSNNEAEYEAFLASGELVLEAGAKMIVIYSDSQLVVNQVQGSYKARDEKMAKYFSKAKNMLGKFEKASVVQVLRANNATTNQLAKLASSMAAIRSRKITFISLERAAIEESEEVICIDPTLLSWKEEIIRFLTKGVQPVNKIDAKVLRRKTFRFVMIDGELYP